MKHMAKARILSAVLFFMVSLLLVINAVGCGLKGNDSNDAKLDTLYQQAAIHQQKLDLDKATIFDIQNQVRAGELSYQELMNICLTRIELYDAGTVALNSIIALNPNAMEEALRADEAVLDNPDLAQGVFGIPVLLKDNINFTGLPTTAGAVALADNVPPYNATLVDSLIENGAIILGKTNMGEFAGMLGTFNYSSVGGTTKHPYRPNRLLGDDIWGASPGGSSAGSAVAASAALAPVTIGTETSGSLLSPAAKTQVATIKPTVGLISRYGIVPVALSQDTPGPMARNVSDLAVALNAMAGKVDPMDAATSAITQAGALYIDYTESLRLDGLSGKRIGLLEPSMLLPGAADNLDLVIKALEDAGAVVVTNADGSKLTYPGDPGFKRSIYYEFKSGLNAYLATLDADFPIKTLGDIISFNIGHPDAIDPEMTAGGQDILIEVNEIDVEAERAENEAIIAEQKREAGADGIDALLNEFNLDAVLDVGEESFLGAMAGYSSVSVPLYYFNDNVQISTNVIFTGTAFSEPLLIELAYVVEQATHFRRAPGLADKSELEEALNFILEQITGKATPSEAMDFILELAGFSTPSEAVTMILEQEALEDFGFAFDVYYNGLSTQAEVDSANSRIRELILSHYDRNP